MVKDVPNIVDNGHAQASRQKCSRMSDEVYHQCSVQQPSPTCQPCGVEENQFGQPHALPHLFTDCHVNSIPHKLVLFKFSYLTINFHSIIMDICLPSLYHSLLPLFQTWSGYGMVTLCHGAPCRINSGNSIRTQEVYLVYIMLPVYVRCCYNCHMYTPDQSHTPRYMHTTLL